MTIDHLFELQESNQISDKMDKLIAESILNAERDWDYPIDDFNEFILILENEIGGEISRQNLDNLLNNYNNEVPKTNSWKAESICYLIDIFQWTGYSNLKTVFNELSNRLNKEELKLKAKTFKYTGFPEINVYENYFEIKSIDHWEFRTFEYSELDKLKLVDPKNKWWYRFYISTSIAGSIFSKNDSIKLVVFKKNGGDWEYKTSSKTNLEFDNIIRKINLRIKSTIGNTV